MAYLPLIVRAIEEDIGEQGDITTDSIVPVSQKGRAVLKAKASGVICGMSVFEDTFFYVDKELKIETFFTDGERVRPGDIIAVVSGSLNSILKAERTALNFIQRMSGISTAASLYSKAVSGTNAAVLDTRKTLPGFRALDKYAVKTGGCSNHRSGLYDMFLIKDNHIASAGGIRQAVSKATAYKKVNKLDSMIEVEVRNTGEFAEALELDVDWIMLDNMGVEDIRKCVILNSGRKKLEISGNVTLERLPELAETGVDFISSGALTHSVTALDLSLIVEQENS